MIPKIKSTHTNRIKSLDSVMVQLRSYKVENGILSGTGFHGTSNVTIATIAACQELGTSIIPSRPFMSLAYKQLKESHTNEMKRNLHDAIVKNGVVRDKPKIKEYFAYLGLKVQTLQQQNIANSRALFKPLSEYTILRRISHSDHPLFDTGILYKSLSFLVSHA